MVIGSAPGKHGPIVRPPNSKPTKCKELETPHANHTSVHARRQNAPVDTTHAEKERHEEDQHFGSGMIGTRIDRKCSGVRFRHIENFVQPELFADTRGIYAYPVAALPILPTVFVREARHRFYGGYGYDRKRKRGMIRFYRVRREKN
jgi:hypothetical protein